MKMVYSAKYSDAVDIPNPFASKKKIRSSNVLAVGMRFVTGLFLLAWLVGIACFLVYPLLPNFLDIKGSFERFDPYDVGFTVTTQMFVKLTPPVYAIEDEIVGDGAGIIRTIEYVNPDEVILSNLESEGTKIVISSAHIDGYVVDGYSQEEMLRGFWHYPASSIPGERGNTVIFGHRYHRIPPRKDTFFNLDDVKIGDKVIVEREDSEISYTIVETKIVEKTDATILEGTGDYRLTLVTCTPLWTAEKRLVVVAIQDEISTVI